MPNAALYAIKLLELIRALLGAKLSADPVIAQAQAVLNQAASEGRDITLAEIDALDDQRHAIEQQIRDAAGV